MQNILILGTGKMARNIGLFFIRNDCRVSWISRNSSRAESFRNQLVKDIRRLAMVMDKQPEDFNTTVAETSNIPQKKYDLIFESIEEDLVQKQKIIQDVQPHLTSDTILASNSSSILPVQIHEAMIGLHFFYPVELTGLLEVITNPNLSDNKIQGIIGQFNSWGINTIIQDEHNAFAVNRLLLPMQAEIFRLLQAGYPADIINECSKSDQIKIGQLELMDSIGFDVLLPAIKNYVSRMSEKDQQAYTALIAGLTSLIKNGKLGKKNKNGLLMGEPLLWQQNKPDPTQIEKVNKNFAKIFDKTRQQFLESHQIEKDALEKVITILFL